ncbi:cysteine protease atg4 [Trichoderma cornu-damae]|uniref:Cysteine protease n=1 Tax=Trichoderma cornu-damae TaxID=654480 RepID=A0A9P8TXS6_9HYPO|nr:cysteine protease atg4 [Trichoderma cornu-damae]
MESNITVDLGRYRRIMQMFWDPEPSNDARRFQMFQLQNRKHEETSESDAVGISPPTQNHLPISKVSAKAPETPPASTSSSLASAVADEEPPLERGWPPGFLEDMASKFWMTYRSGFDPIPKSADPRASSALSFSVRIKSTLSDPTSFSSDGGWGCMIRSGQSLLATTIGILRLGRDWRRGKCQQEERQLISMFADDPRAPYSIHNFCIQYGNYPRTFNRALTSSSGLPLCIYSPSDGQDVYEDSFMKVARPDGRNFHPTLILIGTRLGIDKITPIYWEALIAALQMPQTVGIAGLRRLHVREMDPKNVQGKTIIHVADHEPALYSGGGRDNAVDEVELLSDDDDGDITTQDTSIEDGFMSLDLSSATASGVKMLYFSYIPTRVQAILADQRDIKILIS